MAISTRGMGSVLVWAALGLAAFAGTPYLTAQAGEVIPGEPAASQGQGTISIDVVASDKHNNPIPGLQEQDFTVLDDGKPVKPTRFQAIDATKPNAPVHVILLVDMINTGFNVVATEREDVGQFLQQNGGHLDYDTQLAVMTESGLKVLNASGRDGLALLDEFKQVRTDLRLEGRDSGFWGASDRMGESLQELGQLTDYEAKQPGRKIVLVISPGWALFMYSGMEEDMKQRQQVFSSVVHFTNLLREAQMTLYTLDPFDLGRRDPFLYEGYRKGLTKVDNAEYPYLSLQVLAEHSGGRVLVSARDIKGEINEALRDVASYYELSFDAPSTHDKPNEYHALQVKIDKPGVIARTTAGYYDNPRFTGGTPRPTKP